MLVRLGVWAASIVGVAIFLAAVWLLFQPVAQGGDLSVREVIASETSARWAVLGVLGALLGNALLFLNLRIAAQATDAANVAAVAAKEAVDHARETSRLEFRPYLIVESTDFNHAVDADRITNSQFSFGWRNVGATPARNVRTFINWHAEDAGFDWNRFHFPQAAATAKDSGTIGPGHWMTVNSGRRIPVEEMIAVAEGRREIVVWGAMEYDGADPAVRHRSEHSQRVSAPADPTVPTAQYTTFVIGRHQGSDEDCLYAPSTRPVVVEKKPVPPPA